MAKLKFLVGTNTLAYLFGTSIGLEKSFIKLAAGPRSPQSGPAQVWSDQGWSGKAKPESDDQESAHVSSAQRPKAISQVPMLLNFLRP
jgi:hypothetical protein